MGMVENVKIEFGISNKSERKFGVYRDEYDAIQYFSFWLWYVWVQVSWFEGDW